MYLAWLLTDPMDGDKTVIFRPPSPYELNRYIVERIVYSVVKDP